MAESVGIYFAAATPRAVAAWLDQRLPSEDPESWSILAPDGYLVLIYPYPEYQNEFEANDLERLSTLLGALPSAAFQLELRRRKGREAYDAAVALASEMLRKFDGVLEDILNEVYWSLADLEAGKAAESASAFWPEV